MIIINHIAMQCKRCIDEDLFLTSHQKHLYRNAIRRNRVTGDWELDSDVISLAKTPFAPSITMSAGRGNDLVKGHIFNVELRLRKHKEWRVCLSSYSEDEQIKVKIQRYAIALNKGADHIVSSNIAFPTLSPNTNAAIVLFHDLLTLTVPEKYSGRISRVNRNFEPWAITEWQSQTSATTTVWVPWPTPAFFSHWGYDSFLYYWQAFKETLNSYNKRADIELLEIMVHGWIDSGAAILSVSQPLWQVSPPVWSSAEEYCAKSEIVVARWNALCERLDNLCNARRPRFQPMINDWLRRLAYFVTPSVSGLPSTIIDHFINGGDLEQRIRDSKAKIISDHTEVLTTMFKRRTVDEKGLRTVTIDPDPKVQTKIRTDVGKYWDNKLAPELNGKAAPAGTS